MVGDWAGTGFAAALLSGSDVSVVVVAVGTSTSVASLFRVGISVASVFCVGGDLVVVELKSGRTPREVTAQALDHAPWVKDLEFDEVVNMADR